MTVTRQDAWTADDDLLLAEVTLRHIREGGTQLAAFEEIGEQLGRTAAACGFRWNSYVRKKYEAAIQIAKAQRKQRKQTERIRPMADYEESLIVSSITHPLIDEHSVMLGNHQEKTISFEAVIRFLKDQRNVTKRIKQLEKELEKREIELNQLRQENKQINQQLNHVQTDYQVINDDYKTLIQIMDRARKMAVLTDIGDMDSTTRFKMDANGNLERVE